MLRLERDLDSAAPERHALAVKARRPLTPLIQHVCLPSSCSSIRLRPPLPCPRRLRPTRLRLRRLRIHPGAGHQAPRGNISARPFCLANGPQAEQKQYEEYVAAEKKAYEDAEAKHKAIVEAEQKQYEEYVAAQKKAYEDACAKEKEYYEKVIPHYSRTIRSFLC